MSRELSVEHLDAAIRLWKACGLVMPWNDPEADFRRALATPTSTVLGYFSEHELTATVMAGYDGHRGWIYYLAVDAQVRRQGIGRDLVLCAEAWLRQSGAPKVQLMVRSTNSDVLGFYEALGYERSDVAVLGKRFTP